MNITSLLSLNIKEIGSIVEKDQFPLYSTRVLDTLEIGLQSDLNNGDSLSAAYDVLSRIVERRPQLAEKVFGVLKKACNLIKMIIHHCIVLILHL